MNFDVGRIETKREKRHKISHFKKRRIKKDKERKGKPPNKLRHPSLFFF